jgi:hypothetical protein
MSRELVTAAAADASRKDRVAPPAVANEILIPTAVFRCHVTIAQEVL